MFSRVFVRTVLVAIITAIVWTLSWTWTSESLNPAQRVAVSLIECSVLLAALSLLIESFLSFANLDVTRGSWRYNLFGFWLIDLDEETNTRIPQVNARTCTLFGARSFMLSILSLLAAAVLTILWTAVAGIITFMLSPFVPSVDWLQIGKYAGLLVLGVFAAIFIMQGVLWLENKLSDKTTVVKGTVLTLTLSALFSLVISIMNIFNPIDALPFYLVFFYGMAVCLSLLAFVGTVMAIGFGIYKLAGNLSQRFPVLQSAWNQICPVRTIHFVEN